MSTIKLTRNITDSYVFVDGKFFRDDNKLPRFNLEFSRNPFKVTFDPTEVRRPFIDKPWSGFLRNGNLTTESLKKNRLFGSKMSVKNMIDSRKSFGAYKPIGGNGAIFILKWRDNVSDCKEFGLSFPVIINQIGNKIEETVCFRTPSEETFTISTVKHCINDVELVLTSETDAFSSLNKVVEITSKPLFMRGVRGDKFFTSYLGGADTLIIFDHTDKKRYGKQTVDVKMSKQISIRPNIHKMRSLYNACKYLGKELKLGELKMFKGNHLGIPKEQKMTEYDKKLFEIAKKSVDSTVAKVPKGVIKVKKTIPKQLNKRVVNPLLKGFNWVTGKVNDQKNEKIRGKLVTKKRNIKRVSRFSQHYYLVTFVYGSSRKTLRYIPVQEINHCYFNICGDVNCHALRMDHLHPKGMKGCSFESDICQSDNCPVNKKHLIHPRCVRRRNPETDPVPDFRHKHITVDIPKGEMVYHFRSQDFDAWVNKNI